MDAGRLFTNFNWLVSRVLKCQTHTTISEGHDLLEQLEAFVEDEDRREDGERDGEGGMEGGRGGDNDGMEEGQQHWGGGGGGGGGREATRKGGESKEQQDEQRFEEHLRSMQTISHMKREVSSDGIYYQGGSTPDLPRSRRRGKGGGSGGSGWDRRGGTDWWRW